MTKIALGSCSRGDLPEKQLWNEINDQKPDLWIWLGDAIYGDSDSLSTLQSKYQVQKSNPDYQKLIAETPVIGIWDDHDYGVNDGDRTYPLKRESRDLFFDFLNYPQDHPDRDHEGAYQSYTFGPEGRQVKVILLDARYFRDPLGRANQDANQRYYPDPEGQLLGEVQWKWFEKELRSSKAQIHLVICGIQFLSNQHAFEKWSNFPKERDRLLHLLSSTKPSNLVLISGDRHIAEFSEMALSSDYSVFEMTTSGLSHTWENENEEKNEYRIDRVISRNYGLIEIDWKNPSLDITIKVKGPKNKTLMTHDL